MPFRDVIGHRRVVGLLSRSAHRGTLPPSLIFAGPAGVGKRFAANALAQALNCTKPISSARAGASAPEPDLPNFQPVLEVDACGACAACKRILRGVHPDVLVIEPGENGSIRIDEIRDMIDRASYRPFEGRRRVVIIDDADALVVAAQNALLKTLEEPPAGSVFILITPRPDSLLATVRSRCPQLRFRPLAADEIAAALVRRGASERDARAVAATADGSLARALEASADEFVEAREVAERVLTGAATSRDERGRLETAKDLLAKTGAGGAGDREQLAAHLRAMTSLLRDVELLATRADARALANPDVRPTLDGLQQAYGGDRGIRAFGAVDQALAALERNAGVKIVADWLVLHL